MQKVPRHVGESHQAIRCLNIYEIGLSDSGSAVLYSLTFCHMLPDFCQIRGQSMQAQEKSGGLDSPGGMVGPDNLKGLFQPQLILCGLTVVTKENNHFPLVTGHSCQCRPGCGQLSLLQGISDPSTYFLLGAIYPLLQSCCCLARQCLAYTSDFCHSLPGEGLMFVIVKFHVEYKFVAKDLCKIRITLSSKYLANQYFLNYGGKNIQ